MPSYTPFLNSVVANVGSAVDFATSGISRTIAGRLGSGIAQALVNPLTREFHYQANARGPATVPELEVLTGLYYSRRISEIDFKTLCRYLGVHQDPANQLANAVWTRAIELARPQFDLSAYQKWWRQGRLNYEGILDALQRQGFDLHTGSSRDVALFAFDRENFPPYWAAMLFAMGSINRQQFERVCIDNGFTQEQADLWAESVRVTPSAMQALELWNRGVVDEQGAEAMLRAAGVVNVGDQDRLKVLRLQFPTPSDLIRWSIREVWNPAVVARFGYDQEFPPQFQAWMEKQGMGWSADDNGNQAAPGQGLPIPLAHWRAHWQTIAPSQAFEMLHRFRGNPADPTTWAVPGVRPFTADDVNTILKIADYPPEIRPQLMALSYSVLRLIDIRNAYRLGVRDRDWAIGKFQDRGVTLEDAETQVDLVDATESEKERQRSLARHRSEQAATARQVLEQLTYGIVTEDEAKTAIRGLGYRQETANLAVARAVMKDRLDGFKLVLRRSHLDFLSGRASEEQALNRMMRIGINLATRTKFMDRWKIERGPGRVAFSTSKIIDLFKRGLINSSQAHEYLGNLGWENPEQVLLLAAAFQDIVTRQAKLMEAALKAKKQQEKELAALAKMAQQQAEHLEAINRRQTPLATLKKWLENGSIGKKYYLERMRAMGYSDVFTKEYYYEIFQEDFDGPGNECGAYDPACGTAPTEGSEPQDETPEITVDAGIEPAVELPGS